MDRLNAGTMMLWRWGSLTSPPPSENMMTELSSLKVEYSLKIILKVLIMNYHIYMIILLAKNCICEKYIHNGRCGNFA
jgi:hypothetical protein